MTENNPLIGLQYNGLKVRALAADLAACGHYRIINPLWYLERLGADVRYFTYESVKEGGYGIRDIADGNVIIAQRQYSTAIANTLLNDCLSLGKLVIYEADDNFHAVLPSSPVYGVYHQGSEELKNLTKLIQALDGATVSTPELAGDYSSIAKSIEVVPNGIDFEMRDWTYIPEDKDPNFLYMMFTGGATHCGDLPIIQKPVEIIMKKYDYVKLALFTSNYLVSYIINTWDIPLDRIQVVPTVSFQEYPQSLGWGDIVLVPLENNRFNAAKSNLRYLECSARKIPGVYSVTPPYSTSIHNGVNGFTAQTTDEWVEKISKLVENSELRTSMGEKAYQHVKDCYDMKKLVHLWPQAWQSLENVKRGKAAPKKWPSLWGHVGRNDRCPCGCGKKYKQCEIYPAYGR